MGPGGEGDERQGLGEGAAFHGGHGAHEAGFWVTTGLPADFPTRPRSICMTPKAGRSMFLSFFFPGCTLQHAGL